MKDVLIKEYVVCDGENVRRTDISPPIEVRSSDKMRMLFFPGVTVFQVDWYRGWASGRRSVSVDMPNPGCMKDTVHFVMDPIGTSLVKV